MVLYGKLYVRMGKCSTKGGNWNAILELVGPGQHTQFSLSGGFGTGDAENSRGGLQLPCVVTRRRSDVPQGHPHSGVSKSANPWKPCKNSVHLGNADILSYAGRKCNSLLVVLKRAYPVATATRSREERHSGVATRNRSFCLNSFLW